MSSPRRPVVPSALMLLGLAACSGTPPKDAPDEPKPDVQPDVKPEDVEDDIPIGALYGAPPDDWVEEELKAPVGPPTDDVEAKPDADEKKKDDKKSAEPKADPAE